MMRSTDVVVVPCESGQARLGEGMRWDARRSELVWVDTARRLAHRARIGRGGRLKPVCTYHLPGRPGSITPVEGDEGWIIALERGIHLLRPDGSTLELVAAAPAGARMKNAACDVRGRLWVGSMAEDEVTPIGALYRWDRDGRLQLMVDGLVIPSDIGWSPDGTTMYLADSGAQLMYSYPFDVERGVLGTRRVLLSFEDVDGAPDGFAVDAYGDIWIAMYGGHAIRRYAADGSLLAALEVPAARVTSCAFAGRGFRSLYIATATDGCGTDQRAANADDGLLYRVDTDVAGRSAQPFRPEPHWWARAASGASSHAARMGSGYEIVVAGGHGSMLESALPGFEVSLVRGRRVHLVGNVIDQAALHAALHRLQDLHLDVLELHRLSDP